MMNDFDLVVIDEAAQALEPQCWIALLKGTFPFLIFIEYLFSLLLLFIMEL